MPTVAAAVHGVPQYTREKNSLSSSRVLRLVYCGNTTFKYITAAVDEPQYRGRKRVSHVLRLIYCGSHMYCGNATFKFIAAAVHEPQYTSDEKYLVYCGSCTAAPQLAVVGRIYLAIAPQLEPFYTKK